MESTMLMFSILILLLLLLLLLPLLFACYVLYKRWTLSHIPSPPITNFWSGHTSYVTETLTNGKLPALDHVVLEWCLKLKSDIIVLHFYHVNYVMMIGPENTKQLLNTKIHPKSDLLRNCLGFPCGHRYGGDGLGTHLQYQTWKPRRAMIDPAFHRSYLKSLIPGINHNVNLCLAKLHKFADGKKKIHLHKEFTKLTMNIISNLACGMNIDVINGDNALTTHVNNVMLQAQQIIENPLFQLLPWNWRFINQCKESMNFIRNEGRKVIAERRASATAGRTAPKDLMTYLVAAADQSDFLDDEDVIDDFVNFFTAGHETSAGTLSIMMMEIAHHPKVEERLLEEIHHVVGASETVEDEHLPRLVYLGQVLKESLRLYQMVPVSIRNLVCNEVFGNYEIPAGTDVGISGYANAHHPDYWTRPNDFYPERFENEDVNHNPSMYIPFSAGPRNCIGQYFGQMEVKIAMARFVRDFKFNASPGQYGKVLMHFTASPRDGLLGTILPRKKTQ